MNESNGYTSVFCRVNGTTNRIRYNKKGRWQHTISSYETKRLPEDIRQLLESSFPGFTIFGAVTEVRLRNKISLLVLIENKTSWKRIKVVDGVQEIYEEVQKG